ncbi:DUF2269 family protein [Tepidiforma thermophila]|uniref:Putative integral membrane protein DUF2269 n=1 Tax=Tepidiforma thermophila (strain KCTC 52669 / CGMCC 1.13589 / G233) TaxID=2761530 RepID=A0A2A9HG36_TEPT2|nr:DUF2269 family protein [Tepidiforma thermophila]PFG73779.1 putative integral membrane protein DUF2269 [Tepidiforma thermophila]
MSATSPDFPGGLHPERPPHPLLPHIAPVFVGLGTTFAFPILQAAGEAQGTGVTRFAIRTTGRLETLIVKPAVVPLLLMGVGLIFDDHTGYRDDFPLWLGVAIAWFLAAFTLSSVVQRRNLSRAPQLLDGTPDDAPLPAGYLAHAPRIRVVGAILGASALGILFLMVWKPGQ